MQIATGSDLSQASFVSHYRNMKSAATAGLRSSCSGARNTEILNNLIRETSEEGGGCVQLPRGTFCVYTIELQSNVTILFSEGTVLRAGRPEIDGGNYLPPEVNPCKGIQDGGHTYFANSLFYAHDAENVRITGPGLIDGRFVHSDTGEVEFVLSGADCDDTPDREQPGHQGTWFGNKAIALVRCKNVLLEGFSILIGGHFAILATCVDNLYLEHLMVDTNRDGLDIDACKNVTVRHCTFNSLTDDAIVMKSSMGGGVIRPTENVLIEECTVFGYDAGSVYDDTFTTSKVVADDRGGPTGRIKFGTESTGGCHTITVRRVRFRRCRGFALETVDCAPLHDITLEFCDMQDVSSSPIFIRVGDRGRYPVTGLNSDPAVKHDIDVRIDHPEWVFPSGENYGSFPPGRYQPSYNRTKEVTVDSLSDIRVQNEEQPCNCNPANGTGEDPEESPFLRANAVGSKQLASAWNIMLRKVRIFNADPRYPIILMGLTDSPIRNVEMQEVTVEYRGGITMEMATEQRQLNTLWAYSQGGAPKRVQSLPWLVNSFFAKNEALLPRVRYNPEDGSWQPDPFNVPECVDVYPEPENWGILPAYGMYARHVEGLKVRNLNCRTYLADERPFVVLDDVKDVTLDHSKGHTDDREDSKDKKGLRNEIVCVENHFRRHTNAELVPGQPYFTTGVENLMVIPERKTRKVVLDAPAPGTPRDSLYPYPTVPESGNGYHYEIPTKQYPIPRTVFRPRMELTSGTKYPADTESILHVKVWDPAQEVSDLAPNEGIRDVVSIQAEINAHITPAPHDVYVTGAVADDDETASVLPVLQTGPLDFDLILPALPAGRRVLRLGCDDGILPEDEEIELTIE
jgi:hypothetical protein